MKRFACDLRLVTLILALPLFQLPERSARAQPVADPLPQASGAQPDMTDALQARIDAKQGGLQLAARTYRINRSLVVNLDEVGPASIVGEGTATLIMTGPGPAIRFVGTHTGTADPKTVKENVWLNQRAPQVRSLEIVGAHPEADGIEVEGTMQFTASSLVIRKVRHAIHLVGRNRNVILSDCHLYENRGAGVFYDQVSLHQSNISNCHISYNDAGGIVVRGGDVRNVHITGCDIEGNMGVPGTPPTANVLLDSSGGSIGEVAITGCTIQHGHLTEGSANIRVLGESNKVSFTDERRHGNITISGNVMSDVKCNIHLRQTRGVAITGNTIWEGYQHNLLIESCEAVTISGNTFDRNPRYHYSDGAMAQLAIVLTDCLGCLMSGNVHNGLAESKPGIELRNCRQMQLVSGMLRGYQGTAIRLEQVTQSQIAGLLIESSADEPIEQVNCSANRLENNMIVPLPSGESK